MVIAYQPDLEVFAILKGQVIGAHRIIHDALKPYVRIEPVDGHGFTMKASPRLRLRRMAEIRHSTHPVEFVVMFDTSGIRLLEVSPPPPHVLPSQGLREIRLGAPVVDVLPEGGASTLPRTPPKPRVKPIAVAPEPEPPSLTIPAHLAALCTKLEVHPELGDYLVVPKIESAVYEPRPPWVITTDAVDAVHVVKPRLKEDQAIRSRTPGDRVWG